MNQTRTQTASAVLTRRKKSTEEDADELVQQVTSGLVRLQRRKSRRRRLKRLALLGLLVACLAAGGYFGWDHLKGFSGPRLWQQIQWPSQESDPVTAP